MLALQVGPTRKIFIHEDHGIFLVLILRWHRLLYTNWDDVHVQWSNIDNGPVTHFATLFTRSQEEKILSSCSCWRFTEVGVLSSSFLNTFLRDRALDNQRQGFIAKSMTRITDLLYMSFSVFTLANHLAATSMEDIKYVFICICASINVWTLCEQISRAWTRERAYCWKTSNDVNYWCRSFCNDF